MHLDWLMWTVLLGGVQSYGVELHGESVEFCHETMVINIKVC